METYNNNGIVNIILLMTKFNTEKKNILSLQIKTVFINGGRYNCTLLAFDRSTCTPTAT